MKNKKDGKLAILGHLDVSGRFELLKDLFGSLKHLTTDKGHHSEQAFSLELLDRSSLLRMIRGNGRLYGVLRQATCTLRHKLHEEDKKVQAFITSKRKQAAKGLGTRDLSYRGEKPHPSDDYWDPETNAIDDTALCADKRKEDFAKNQKKIAEAQARKVQKMTP